MAVIIQPPLPANVKPGATVTTISSQAPADEITAVLKSDGAVILSDFLAATDLAQLMAENEEIIRTQSPAQTTPIVVDGLVGHSDTAAKICETPVLEVISNAFVTERVNVTLESGFSLDHVVTPLLSASKSYRGPLPETPKLVRDDYLYNYNIQRPLDPSLSVQYSLFLAGSDITAKNGAPVVVPGSHLWEEGRTPEDHEVALVEIKAGSALVFLGATYHGQSSSSDGASPSTMFRFTMIRGTKRTEENQFLLFPRSKVPELGQALRPLLGYAKPTATLGTYNFQCPTAVGLARVVAEAGS